MYISITLLDNLTYRTCHYHAFQEVITATHDAPLQSVTLTLSRAPPLRQEVKGEFCECDNFSCDRHEKRLCSGPEHGSCVCGKCSCLPDWTGEACQCPASNATCIAPGQSGWVRSGQAWSGLV